MFNGVVSPEAARCSHRYNELHPINCGDHEAHRLHRGTRLPSCRRGGLKIEHEELRAPCNAAPPWAASWLADLSFVVMGQASNVYLRDESNVRHWRPSDVGLQRQWSGQRDRSRLEAAVRPRDDRQLRRHVRLGRRCQLHNEQHIRSMQPREIRGRQPDSQSRSLEAGDRLP